MERRLVAAIACRNQGSRLYGKPVQNLDVNDGIRIIDNIVDCLKSINCVDEIILGISEGIENEVFKIIAEEKGIRFVVGDQNDVLSRLIECGKIGEATDIFRVTSESPFLYFQDVEKAWLSHKQGLFDATFMDEIIDGCGFEIISLKSLQKSHENGSSRHRSELCTLYIRENKKDFAIHQLFPLPKYIRKDIRLTVDNPEDLAVCRIIYSVFKQSAPRIPLDKIIEFMDNNEKLKEWIAPYTESGYATMYK
jgi:spore coat polysaccharide biosynthesis protein SpsF